MNDSQKDPEIPYQNLSVEEKWELTLQHTKFVKAILQREFSGFLRFEDDLFAEGLIAYFRTLGTIQYTRMRWIYIRNHLWEYLDTVILVEKNNNRKYSVEYKVISEFPLITLDNGDSYFLPEQYMYEYTDIVEVLDREEFIESLHKHLDEFDSKIVDLMYLGYSQVEIAEELDVPVYIIYNHLKIIRRTAQELRDNYKGGQ